MLQYESSFVKIGRFYINLKNVAFIDFSDYADRGRSQVPCITIAFNAGRNNNDILHLALTGELLSLAEDAFKIKWEGKRADDNGNP